MYQLTEDDSLAVDMLLEPRLILNDGGTVIDQAMSRTRLDRVEAILQKLQALPAEEPPANLVEKVMRKIDHLSRQNQPGTHAFDQGNAPAAL